jgi:hypothetical protein
MRKSSRRDSRSRERVSIFFREEGMNVWPPNPGFPLMTQNMMNQGKDFIEEVDRCGRVDDHVGFAAM